MAVKEYEQWCKFNVTRCIMNEMSSFAQEWSSTAMVPSILVKGFFFYHLPWHCERGNLNTHQFPCFESIKTRIKTLVLHGSHFLWPSVGSVWSKPSLCQECLIPVFCVALSHPESFHFKVQHSPTCKLCVDERLHSLSNMKTCHHHWVALLPPVSRLTTAAVPHDGAQHRRFTDTFLLQIRSMTPVDSKESLCPQAG